MLEEQDRIGVSALQLPSMLKLAKSLGVKINGLHVYVGTNFHDHRDMLPTVQKFFEIAESVPELEYFNIGGGIGVDYSHKKVPFDLKAYGSQLKKFASNLIEKKNSSLSIIVEPGRSMVADMGKFIVQITDIKKLNDKTYVGVNSSIAKFPRPFHHPESLHFIEHLGRVDDSVSERPLIEAIIVGQTTFSKDILGIAKLPNNFGIGDHLVFFDSGAYSYSMSSRFLGQKEPEIQFVGQRTRK